MVGIDKWLHFFVSYVLALFDPLVAAMAGMGKETVDQFCGMGADIFDLLADGLGILLAMVS